MGAVRPPIRGTPPGSNGRRVRRRPRRTSTASHASTSDRTLMASSFICRWRMIARPPPYPPPQAGEGREGAGRNRMSDAATALREPWPDLDRQREGVSVGIWLFIVSEVLFFGALFLGYAVYRALYPEAFRIAAGETEVFYGSVNLVLLLTSSVTMTIAVDASRQGMRRTVVACLALTMLLGIAFLLFKGLEYSTDIAKGLLPGAYFPLQPPQTQLFWALYWVMTGVHAVHLAIGIGIVGVFALILWRRLLPIESPAMLGVATYWHFVDTVWIILFPLLYLVDRS